MWGSASRSQAHSPSIANLPTTTSETTLHSLGRQRWDLLFSHPPSLPSCASVVCTPRYRRLGWSRQPHLGRQVYYRNERFACSVPKFSPACDELGTPQTPRHRLHCRLTASASAVTSPIGFCQKYMWDARPGSA